MPKNTGKSARIVLMIELVIYLVIAISLAFMITT